MRPLTERLRRLVCTVRGHDWRTEHASTNAFDFVTCSRCPEVGWRA